MMKRTRTRLGVARPKVATTRMQTTENSEVTRNRNASAQQSYERYVSLAMEAKSMGDRIMSENYYQHAEHFLRILKEAQSIAPIAVAPSVPAFSETSPLLIEEEIAASLHEPKYPNDMLEFDIEMELQEQHKI